MTAEPTVAAGRRPWWRRSVSWGVLVIVVLGGALLLAAVGSGAGSSSTDPGSTDPSGSRALVRVLAGYGTPVTATRTLHDVGSAQAVLVTDPNAYSDDQLRALTRPGRRVVLLEPGLRALRAVSSIEPSADGSPEFDPGCELPAALAAGGVSLGTGSAYTGGTTTCYGGLVAVDGDVVALGSADLLRNDHLGLAGVAALDVNLLSADRTVHRLVWLRPGSDAAGPGAASVWDVFPDSWHRAFVWMILVGVVVVLWRARRLGPVVTEPLPVVVRSAELVEGQARLHERAQARDRAAASLRDATRRRLITRLGLPRDASPMQVAAAAAPVTGWGAADAHDVLDGPPPTDDAGLLRVVAGLDALEAAVRGGPNTAYTWADRTDERTTPR